MKRLSFTLCIGLLFVPGAVQSQTILTTAEINECDEQGRPTFEGILTQARYSIEGVALNDADIFNAWNESTGEQSASFILFVQDQTGGIQIYSGSWYDGGLSIYPTIKQGERVRITGLTGFFGGKTNINDRHNKDQTFTIERLGQETLPEPIGIDDLDSAKPFDPTRASGGEYYQGRLVKLRNVHIVEGNWGHDEIITVENAAGQTFPVQLHFGTNIADHPRPDEWFDLIGVFNQEDTTEPYTSDYILWPRSINDFQAIQSHINDWREYQ